MWRKRLMPVVAVAALLAVTLPAHATQATNCAYALVPTGQILDDGAQEADVVEIGCYSTLSQAVAAGTDGATKLPAGAQPTTTTQALVDASTTTTSSSLVLIGIEYTAINYTFSSSTYYAPETCSSGVIWEDPFVGDLWNNDFESGIGYGGCDVNKKFSLRDFGGDVLTCTPNCANYGFMANRVSSLRWKP